MTRRPWLAVAEPQLRRGYGPVAGAARRRLRRRARARSSSSSAPTAPARPPRCGRSPDGRTQGRDRASTATSIAGKSHQGDRAAGRGPRAPGPGHVRRPVRGRQHARRGLHPQGQARSRADIDRWYDDVPPPAASGGRSWPGACRGGEQQMLAVARALMGRPRAAAARRAVARPGADHRAGPVPALRRAERGGGHDDARSSSRTPTWRSTSPTGRTCWRRARPS